MATEGLTDPSLTLGDRMTRPDSDATAPDRREPAESAPPCSASADVAGLQTALVAELATALTDLFGQAVRVAASGRMRRTYGEFLASLTDPGCCSLLAPELRGEDSCESSAVWVELPAGLAYACVDLLLGGDLDEGVYVPCRPLSGVERGLLRRVVRRIGACLSRCWPVQPSPEFRPADDGAGDRAADGPAHMAPVLVLSFGVSVGPASGQVRICAPESLLGSPPESSDGRVATGGPVEVSVTLPEFAMSADDVASLSPGDILVTDTPSDGQVVVRVAGIPKYVARLGACNERRAVTISGPVSPPRSDAGSA